MKKTDIFNEDNMVTGGEFFKFEKVGDKISGEYLGFYHANSQFGEQRVFRIKNDEGLFNVSFKTNKKFVLDAMENAEEGDIVGFKFTNAVDVGKGNPAKNIQVYLQKTTKKETTDEQPGFKKEIQEEDLPF